MLAFKNRIIISSLILSIYFYKIDFVETKCIPLNGKSLIEGINI
jgi:hypothetical protein